MNNKQTNKNDKSKFGESVHLPAYLQDSRQRVNVGFDFPVYLETTKMNNANIIWSSCVVAVIRIIIL